MRKPVTTNMTKALATQYTIGLAIYYGISIAGYWAYGASVSAYLPEELSGPTWAKVLINGTAFLQSIMSQHVSRNLAIVNSFSLLYCKNARPPKFVLCFYVPFCYELWQL